MPGAKRNAWNSCLSQQWGVVNSRKVQRCDQWCLTESSGEPGVSLSTQSRQHWERVSSQQWLSEGAKLREGSQSDCCSLEVGLGREQLSGEVYTA